MFFIQSQSSDPITRAYGKTASSSSSDLITPDTTFLQASVSKVFTAAAVSILIDRNIIKLDDDICDIVPSNWDRSTCRNPSYPNVKVTWRMLVTHRSSLREDVPSVRDNNGDLVDPGYGPTGGYAEGTAAGNPSCPLTDVVQFYQDFMSNKETETTVGSDMKVQGGGSLNWYSVAQANGGAWKGYRPGSRNRYSNFAVGYIAALIELATGASFSDFCRDNLFQPLGMENTAWFKEDLPNAQHAVPVEHRNNNNFRDIGHYCFIDYASGQLYTTAEDMSKWASAMLDFGAPILWSEETGRKMFQCQERNAQGNLPNNCQVGMGWYRLDNSMKANAESYLNQFKKYDWTNGGMHDGAEAGSQTQLIVLPNAGIFASVMTNTDLNDEYAPQKMASTLAATPLPNNPLPTPQPTTRAPTGSSMTPVPTTRSPTDPPMTPAPTTRSPTDPPMTPAPTTRSPTDPPMTPAPTNPAPATPSPVPNPAPCSDSTSPIWINSSKGYQTCSWLAKKSYWRDYLCGWDTDADFLCQKTCGSCNDWDNIDYEVIGKPSKCYNLDIEFFVNNNVGWKTCDWLATRPRWQDRLCGYDTDADYACRKLCGSCNYWN